ncbi:holin [Niallia taxi]|uniref:Holin n=1 Tax=Niallia taxi TaxID=2499688 RepID=A0A3S3SGS9_9BACI|nr:holin [Niallia taxi]RVT57416.1 holin [Niallia taxi]
MKRFKNYVLWTAVASLIGMALVDFGVIPDTALFNEYVEKALYIAVLLGVVNNPSNGTGLKDAE